MSMSDAPSNGDFENTNSDHQESNNSTSGDDGVRRGAVERGLFMVLFGVIGYFVFWAVVLLAVIQWVFVMINKSPNDDIGRFSANLAEYLAQIARYLGYASDEKPCPFSPFPSVKPGD